MKENYKFATRELYLKALDSVLPDQFVQERSTGSGSVHRYYPFAIKEAVADDLFQNWNVTDENYIVIANEIVCTVRLTYVPSYPDAPELMCTGSAATPIQMNSGAKVTDFPQQKKLNALEYNLPSVRSEAISCALGGLGNVFGRNLSRKLNQKQSLPSNFTIRKHDIPTEQ